MITREDAEAKAYAALDVDGNRLVAVIDLVIATHNAALEMAAEKTESMVVGGRMWTDEQKAVADALFAAATGLRALKIGGE